MTNPPTAAPVETIKKRKLFQLRNLGFFLLTIITGAMIAVWLYLVSGKQVTQPLQLLNRSPKSAEFEAANTTAPIFLYFDQPIDPASAVVEISPASVRLTAMVRPDRQTVLILTPNASWTTNQTVVITIKKNLVSPDKHFRLPADASFQFIVKPLPRQIFDRPI